MKVGDAARSCVRALSVLAVVGGAVVAMPAANADNERLIDDIVANVYTIQQQNGCSGEVKIDPQLRQAAQWHADDVLNNPALDGDIGSDGTTAQDRANAAGFKGVVSETVAVNPALAINGVVIMNQWYHRPDYLAIMSNCANTQIGVSSVNGLDRSVVVAVYGQPG